MSLVLWCPQCDLPLTADEAVDGHCSLCGALLPATLQTVAGDQPLSEAKPQEVPPSLLGRWQLWVGSASLVLNLVLIGVVVAMWLELPPDNKEQQARNDTNRAEEKPKLKAEEPGSSGDMGPPDELKQAPKNSELVGPPDSLKPTPVVAVKPHGFVGPPDNLKPPVVVKPTGPVGPPDNLQRTVVVIETLLNDPNGEFVVAGLQDGKSLKLTGKVKRLKITGQINSRATLDASRLEAQEIILEHGIYNEATVMLNAPNGAVECRSQISGKVKLSINAPNGSVTFKTNASIMNEAKLTLTAGRLDFQDRIVSNVQIDATLTAGGRLKFKEIANGSKVHYKKADPKDPDVVVVAGDVTTQGELRPTADARKRALLVGPPDELRPPLRAALNPKVNGTETHLDDPDGEFVVAGLQDGKTLKLTGKVKRLKITGQITGRVTLDASQLEAQEIIVAQGIVNDATVKLNAPNGSVEFRGPLNGRVNVYVNAPKGTVTFKANSSQITNEAKVQITAGTVEFNDLIHGWNTLVETTLTAGGRLQFKEIANGCKVQYKKAKSNDPDLEIILGTVRDAAELRKSN